MANQERIKLHLGCGEKYLEGYVNIDYPQDQHSVMKVKADKYAEMRTLQYPDNSVDEIRSHHMFEHFTRGEALRLLARWRRWLKPDGVLIIETPDFEAAAAAYVGSLSRRRRFGLGRHMFGSQEAPWAIHYDFWDKPKFAYVLKSFGFTGLKFKRWSNGFGKHFSKIPFANFIGSFLPEWFYRKHGSNALPNILVTAHKGAAVIDEAAVAREVLSQYLVGKEGEAMLSVWLKEFNQP